MSADNKLHLNLNKRLLVDAIRILLHMSEINIKYGNLV